MKYDKTTLWIKGIFPYWGEREAWLETLQDIRDLPETHPTFDEDNP